MPVSLADFPNPRRIRHRCERCGASISPRRSRKTATGYQCKRNSACGRAASKERAS